MTSAAIAARRELLDHGELRVPDFGRRRVLGLRRRR
jgi:hypothetical protein